LRPCCFDARCRSSMAENPEQLEAWFSHLRAFLVERLGQAGPSIIDPEDLADEALLRLLTRPHILRDAAALADPLRHLEPAALTIARHLQVDEARRRRGRTETELVDAESLASTADESERWQEVSSEELRRAIDRLPPRLAESLRMRYLEGEPYAGMAARLGVRTATVGSWLLRAREALRRQLDPGGEAKPLPGRSAAQRRRLYAVRDCTLGIEFGDITTSSADVIVSSDDTELTMAGGVSAALLRAGGETVLLDAAKGAPARTGDVVVTTAGILPARYLFHAITLGEDAPTPGEVLPRVTRRCLELLSVLGLRSIAFPAIGAGVAGFSFKEVAVQMAEVIVSFLSRRDERYTVTLFLHDPFGQLDPLEFMHFFEQFALRTEAMAKAAAPAAEEEKAPEGGVPLRDRRQVLRELAQLEEKRRRLESRLAASGDLLVPGEASSIQSEIGAIQRQRIELLPEISGHAASEGVEVFISYARNDEPLRQELGKHLSVLERQGHIRSWHDRRIGPGSEWKQAIDNHLDSARVILMLISANFISSKYCYEVEMHRAMERHRRREALVIPIILKPVAFQDMPFAQLQALPRNARPAIEWPSLDAAFADVTEGLREAILSIRDPGFRSESG
jgi:RNA polymerase sigma factor (sigma-70 family)